MKLEKAAKTRIKVVLDTSCYVASLLSVSGASAKIVELVINGKIFNFYTEEILAEVREVISRKKFKLTKEQQECFIHLTQETSFLIKQLQTYEVNKCRDPNDDKFLSLANQIEADFIITIDNDLLALRTSEKTKIVAPNEFLTIKDD